VRILNVIHRIARASIWGPTSVEPKDARVRSLMRIYLPLYYFLVIAFGVAGFFGGIPALRDVFDDRYAHDWAATLAITAFACLLGVAWPAHLWRVEFAGMWFMVSLVIVYCAALAIAGIVAGDLGRGGVGFFAAAAAVLPVYWAGDIAREREVHGWK
jgi:hypothetical protein